MKGKTLTATQQDFVWGNLDALKKHIDWLLEYKAMPKSERYTYIVDQWDIDNLYDEVRKIAKTAGLAIVEPKVSQEMIKTVRDARRILGQSNLTDGEIVTLIESGNA